MSVEIVAAWIGVAGAAIVGGLGWVFAGLANSRATKANKLAEAANSIAEDARTLSVAANETARDANQLSEKSNTLSERTLLYAAEESFVQWLPEWDAQHAALTLVNAGRDIAFQPSIVVTGQEIHQVGSGENTDSGEKVTFPLPQIVEKREKLQVGRIGRVGGNQVPVPRALRLQVSIVVLWKTEHDFQRQQRIEFEICEGKTERRAGVW